MTATKKPADKAAAEAAKLSLPQWLILKALVKAGGDGLTYREIQKKTGYYSILTAQLRTTTLRGTEIQDNLGTAGLVKEIVRDTDDGFLLAFRATAKGVKLVEKATAKAKG